MTPVKSTRKNEKMTENVNMVSIFKETLECFLLKVKVYNRDTLVYPFLSLNRPFYSSVKCNQASVGKRGLG